jgi:hypothetical protein
MTLKMTHEDYRVLVTELLQVFGYQILSILPAMRGRTRMVIRDGQVVETPVYVTPVAGNGKGFPDIYAIRPPRCVVAEIKVGNDRLRPEQKVWLELFKLMPNTQAWELRPENFDDFKKAVQ